MANLHDQCRKFESKGATGSPTIFHDLLRRVDELDKLLRVYSQNVDGFEGDAGLGFVEFDKKGNRPLGENGGKTVKRETGGAQDDSASDYETTSRGRLPRKRRRTSRSPLVGIDSNEWASLPRAQKVVAMHGSLKSVVCSACEWVGDWDDQTQESFTNGDQVECPRCEERGKFPHRSFRGFKAETIVTIRSQDQADRLETPAPSFFPLFPPSRPSPLRRSFRQPFLPSLFTLFPFSFRSFIESRLPPRRRNVASDSWLQTIGQSVCEGSQNERRDLCPGQSRTRRGSLGSGVRLRV